MTTSNAHCVVLHTSLYFLLSTCVGIVLGKYVDNALFGLLKAVWLLVKLFTTNGCQLCSCTVVRASSMMLITFVSKR